MGTVLFENKSKKAHKGGSIIKKRAIGVKNEKERFKVLVAHHSLRTRMVLSKMLISEGFELGAEAENLWQCLKQIRQTKVDILVLEKSLFLSDVDSSYIAYLQKEEGLKVVLVNTVCDEHSLDIMSSMGFNAIICDNLNLSETLKVFEEIVSK